MPYTADSGPSRTQRPGLLALCAALLCATGLALADTATPQHPEAGLGAHPGPAQAPAQGPGQGPAQERDQAPAQGAEGDAVATQPPAAAPSPDQPAQKETALKELNSDLVYSVLVAELAGRRGDMDQAFTHYLHAAQLARDPKMAELAVRSALAGESSEGADQAVALWLLLEPDSVGAHQLAALLRLKANDREGVLTHLARVVQLSGSDAGAGYAHAAGIIARAGTDEERVDLMQALAGMDAENPDAQYALAMVAAAAHRPEVAESAAHRALELRPNWNKPQIFLVRLLLSEDKRDEARALLEDYVAAAPGDGALRMLYGQFLVEEKEFSSARSEFERLLSTQPKEPDVLFAVAILSLQLDDLDAARIYFTRLYQTGQRRSEAAYYLGQVEEQAEHPAAAIDWYVKATGANETEAQVRIAVLEAKRGEVARSREILQRLRDQSPEQAETLYLVEAEILDEAGHQGDATAVYAAALEAFPQSPDLLYARAMYSVKHDQLDQAEADLRRILDQDPNHADALNALGYTLADRTHRYEEARELIEKAYQLKPDEPAILDSMGWVNYRLGNYEDALGYLRRALAVMEDGEIAAHLGEVLWAMGRHDEAWQVWEAALKDHPEHASLLEVVSRHRVTQSESNP